MISHEIGKLIYLTCHEYIHAEIKDCTEKIVEATRNELVLEDVINGIMECWFKYEHMEIDNQDVVEMLEEYKLL